MRRSRRGSSRAGSRVLSASSLTVTSCESAAEAGPGLWWQAALALHEEVVEPVADLDQVLDAAERRAGPGQLVALVRDAHQANRSLQPPEAIEERLRLPDRRPDVPLGVLDKERRPHR